MYGYESLTVHDLCGVIIEGDEILNIEIQFNLFSRAPCFHSKHHAAPAAQFMKKPHYSDMRIPLIRSVIKQFGMIVDSCQYS